MKLLTVQSSPASVYFLLSLHLEHHQCYLFPNIMRYQASHTHIHNHSQPLFTSYFLSILNTISVIFSLIL